MSHAPNDVGDGRKRPAAWQAAAGLGAVVLLGLLAVGGAAARPHGFYLGLPRLGPAACVVIVGSTLFLLAGRRRREAGSAALGLLPLALLVLSGLPIPGLSALTGPPLGALALTGLVIVLVVSGWRPPRWAFLPVVLALYAAVSFQVQRQVGPQGDEPHYLMVAESLIRDHDLSLEADYREGRYQAFFNGRLSPHYRVRGKAGEVFSLHAVGLSLLLLPAYALGGYPAASFFMALLAALLAREIRELLLDHWKDEALADGVGWAIALGPPLIHYAGLIFTEVPAALLLAVALRRLRQESAPSARSTLTVGLALAALPWLNVRYAPLAVLVALYALWRRGTWRDIWAVWCPVLASALGLAAYHRLLYGFFDPRLVYGRRPEFSLSTLPEGLPGLLLDQEFGLLIYAPLFTLAAPGIVALWRRDRRLAVTVALVCAVTLLTAGTWHMWRGGFNPPARFLVPVIPLLALAVAGALRKGVGTGPALLIAFTVWAGISGAAEPRLVHRDRDGTAPFWRARAGAEEWTRFLPGYVLEEPGRHRLALLWGLGLVAAVLARRRPTARRVALGTSGLLVCVGIGSSLSPAKTEGRDAARLVGHTALAVPGWRLTRVAGEWGTDVLDWGPLYEPHRHPEGLTLGARLNLSPGTYGILLDAEGLATAGEGVLEVRPESGPSDPDSTSTPRRSFFQHVAQGFAVNFEVRPGERAVTLRLRGGPAFLLRRIRVEAQPIAGGPV